MAASLSRLVPELQPWARSLIDVSIRAGAGGRVTSTFRTLAQQTKLYNEYLAGNARYPVARPGTSAHEYGMAFDLAVPDKTDQSDLGKVWESWGGVWGGHYGDPVHFEFPGFKAPGSQTAPKTGCSKVTSALASTADFVLGFVPGIGEVELVATLVGLGFPRSRVLAWLANPVSGTVCR